MTEMNGYVSTAEIEAAPPEARDELKIVKGALAEERFVRAMRVYPPPPWLVRIRRGTADEDRRGADFVAECSGGLEVPIQIKSSVAAAKAFLEHGRRLGIRDGAIAILVVTPAVSDPDLHARAVRSIGMARSIAIRGSRLIDETRTR